MLFNSLDFAIFLPMAFGMYWMLRNNLRIQNFLLLILSYIFYGWWDYRFLSLIFISSLADFLIAKKLDSSENEKHRKFLLLLSFFINLGFLFTFKYYNFFLDSLSEAFTFFGSTINPDRLDIVLPVGISFYTFQTLSYTIDVYKRKLSSSQNWIEFFAYVSFFPQLVAGPIERATNLIPQFQKQREFNYSKAVDGMRQILWGLFKKVVVADTCSVYVDQIFSSYAEQSSLTLIIGAILFSFQIYGDFSGYSDIAIGTGRLFGFNLMRNFAYPYFSRDIAEFWRRWHISLSTWFRDYLYIPLGGSRVTKLISVRNILIIFIVSGFWHGANWTFIVWGALNALYFLPLLLTGKNRNNIEIVAEGKGLPGFIEVFKILRTFLLSTFAWIFFRSETISDALSYLKHIYTNNITSLPTFFSQVDSLIIISILGVLISIEWMSRNYEHGLQFSTRLSKLVTVPMYYALFFTVWYFSSNQQSFIYFQF